MFILVLAAFVIIALLELVPLYKGRDKNKKEFILYSGLYFIALILSLLMSVGVKLPSVSNFIKVIVEFVKKGLKVE